MSERDYIIEKKSLEEQLSEIDRKLRKIEQSSVSQFSLSDEAYMAKASSFLINRLMREKRFINFDTLVRRTDPKILKEFMNSVVRKIVVFDGKIVGIRFKNGLEHKFLYEKL